MAIMHDLPHWNYFRLLERDLEGCFAYAAPCAQNFHTRSDRFAQIVLLSCAEIENALAGFAAALSVPRPKSINAFQPVVVSRYPKFNSSSVRMPRFALAFEPWMGWDGPSSKAPDWWTNGYNKLKHDRISHPGAGSMINAILSVAALEVLLLHAYTHSFPDWEMPVGLEPTLLEVVEEDRTGMQDMAWSWLWRPPRS